MERIKKVGSILLRFGVSAALLLFLLSKMDGAHILPLIRGADPWFLSGAVVVTLSTYVLCYYRWKMLLNGVGVYPSHRKLLSAFCGGIFFNLFLPSTVGGDFVRTFDLAQRTQKGHEVAATVIMDRINGYAGMVIVALAGIMYGGRLIDDKGVVLAVLGLTAGLILICVVLFNDGIFNTFNGMLKSSSAGRIRKALQRVHEEVYFFRSQRRLLAKSLFVSVIIQIVCPVASYMIAAALGIKVSLIYFLVFLPIISAVSVLPITTGGLGLRDVLTVFFFAKVGVARNAAFAMSLIGFAYLLVFALIGGLIYVFTLHPRRV